MSGSVKGRKNQPCEVAQQASSDIVMVVGCGGVFFHGLTQLSTWARRRDKCHFVLIDFDKVEERNGMRQWGWHVGMNKAVLGAKVLSEVFGLLVSPVDARLSDEKDVYKLYKGFNKLRGARFWVMSSPDNHRARVLAHGASRYLSQMIKSPVVDITAGNDEMGGYAYGSLWLDGVAEPDWLVRRADIAEEAEREVQELAHPLSCGSLPVEPEQTVQGNVLTANCMWGLAESMARGGDVIETSWKKTGAGIVLAERKQVIYDKVKENRVGSDVSA